MTSPYGVIISVALVSFAIVSVFLGLFDESVLSILTCASADMDMHGGDPKWGPVSLNEVIEKLYPREERIREYEEAEK